MSLQRIITIGISLSFLIFSIAFSSNVNDVAAPNIVFEALALNRDIATAAKPLYLSPAAIVHSPDKKKLYVAEQTAKRIAIVNIETRSITKSIRLPNEVTGVAVSPDGSKLYATCSSELWPEGFVYEIDESSGKIFRNIKVGHSARAPVVSPDGKTLYVCNQFSHDISVVDINAGRELRRLKVIREPYAAKITPDGKTLVVVNSVPLAKATDSASVHCDISLIDVNSNYKINTIGLTHGSHSAFGVSITPDGKYALITHLVGYYTLQATRIDAGRIHTNNLAIVDITNKKLLNDISLDYSTDIGCANPWDVECSEDGKFVCVTHAGSNELSIIDFSRLLEISNGTDWLGGKFGALDKTSIRKRVPVKGKTPRALAINNNKVYTAGYFSNYIEEYDVNLSTSEASAKIDLGNEPLMTKERNGEYHYYCGDNNHCYGAWQSCNSCHPLTRPDALNWILSGANGAPKNTKSILYSWWTPRTDWIGKRASTRDAITFGIQNKLRKQPQDSIQLPMEAFLIRLKPVPSPYLVKGQLSESAKRGREIFYNKDKVDCSKCHPGNLFTNLQSSQSICNDIWDPDAQIDVPSLNECWRTAPWDHIGSSLSMDSISINKFHSVKAFKLSETEIKDLVEFVLSL